MTKPNEFDAKAVLAYFLSQLPESNEESGRQTIAYIQALGARWQHSKMLKLLQEKDAEIEKLKKRLKPYQHNHVTRDIKPKGQCPSCDVHHSKAQLEKAHKLALYVLENSMPNTYNHEKAREYLKSLEGEK